MSETLDLLQIKIDKAKATLPEGTRRAIEAVDWKSNLMKLRSEKGYTFEQLENLEIETDLLLAGLITTEAYPKELESRLRISKEKVKELVTDMNNLVFSKIKAELIKNSERNKAVRVNIETTPKKPQIASQIFDLPELEMPKHEEDVLNKAGIQVVTPKMHDATKQVWGTVQPKIEVKKTEPIQKQINSLVAQKLTNNFQMPKAETDHSVKSVIPQNNERPKVDPYREIPE